MLLFKAYFAPSHFITSIVCYTFPASLLKKTHFNQSIYGTLDLRKLEPQFLESSTKFASHSEFFLRDEGSYSKVYPKEMDEY